MTKQQMKVIAQAEHEILPAPLLPGDQLLAVQDAAPLQHTPDIGIQIPDKGIPPPAEVGVGSGAKADIGPGEPIAQVVPGLVPRLCEVGDLILGKARPRQAAHRPQIAVGLGVVVGEHLPLLHSLGQGGALLHLQAIAG